MIHFFSIFIKNNRQKANEIKKCFHYQVRQETRKEEDK